MAVFSAEILHVGFFTLYFLSHLVIHYLCECHLLLRAFLSVIHGMAVSVFHNLLPTIDLLHIIESLLIHHLLLPHYLLMTLNLLLISLVNL